MNTKWILLLLVASAFSPAWADDQVPQSTQGLTPSPKVEKIDVSKLKEKYWAKGDESEMRVIQNRLYSKAGKFELGILGANLASDPFLSVQSVGAKLGYYFSEYFGVNLLGWKAFATGSSAETFLQQQQHVNADTNNPKSFFGAEAAWVPVYGKLSLLGRLIIYYDLHLTGGLGATSTITGTEFTPFVGIGQEFYLNHYFALSLDYKAMFYGENVPNNNPGLNGDNATIIGNRRVTTSAVILGVNFLFD